MLYSVDKDVCIKDIIGIMVWSDVYAKTSFQRVFCHFQTKPECTLLGSLAATVALTCPGPPVLQPAVATQWTGVPPQGIAVWSG